MYHPISRVARPLLFIVATHYCINQMILTDQDGRVKKDDMDFNTL